MTKINESFILTTNKTPDMEQDLDSTTSEHTNSILIEIQFRETSLAWPSSKLVELSISWESSSSSQTVTSYLL